MKVLILAYACEPNRGSEPGLGWNISSEIARRHDVTMIVRANNRAIIEDYLREHPEHPHNRSRFLYFDRDGLLRRIKGSLPFGTQLYFSLWLKTALQVYRQEINAAEVVHQLTFCPFFVRPWGAELTARYVWGPVGGGGGPYARFDPKFLARQPFPVRMKERIYQLQYWLINSSVFGASFRRTRAKAKAVLFKSTAFSNGYFHSAGQLVKVTRETGFGGECIERKYNVSKHPLKMLNVGNMIPSKAMDYAIRAFALFLKKGGNGELHFLGDGPCRLALEKLIKSLGVEDQVILHGKVPNTKVHEMLDCVDLFFFPSFSEATPWALLEAMSHGLPIVCHKRSGIADLVTESCGTPVTCDDPDRIVELYADALMSYYKCPERLAEHGCGAVERVKRHYSWEAIGQQFDEVYDFVKEHANV